VGGLAFCIRADIQDNGSMSGESGKDGGQRGPIDLRKRADDELRYHHNGAGVARADKSLGLAISNQLGSHAYRAVLLPSDRDGDRVIHRDDFRSIDYFNARASPVSATAPESATPAMLVEFRLNLLRSADEDDPDSQIASSFERAFDLARRSVIATHGIHCDLEHKDLGIVNFKFQISNFKRYAANSEGSKIRNSKFEICLFFFFHLDDDAAAVKPTFGTHTMRQARLAAMGTASHGRRSQMIMSPALARARL
jgi:hypothetical protein